MIRHLYIDEDGLYSLDEYVPALDNYCGCVDIHNEEELDNFLDRMKFDDYTSEDVKKALKVDKYELISRQLHDFIHSTDSGTNETIETLVDDIVNELGGDSYCCSIHDHLNKKDICTIHDFGNDLFYKTVETILNVIETFER